MTHGLTFSQQVSFKSTEQVTEYLLNGKTSVLASELMLFLDLIDSPRVVEIINFLSTKKINRPEKRFFMTYVRSFQHKCFNNCLLNQLKIFKEEFNNQKGYQEYFPWDFYTALKIQGDETTRDTLNVEIEQWKKIKSDIADSNSRKYKVASSTIENLIETTLFIERNENMTNFHERESLFYGSENIRNMMIRKGYLDTVEVLQKIHSIKEIRLDSASVPQLYKKLEYGGLLRKESSIEVLYSENNAIMSFRNANWSAVYLVKLYSSNNLTLKYLSGGIE